MSSENQKPDDLQHLVDKEFRDKVTVIPGNSLQSAFIAWGCIVCGFGFVFGAMFSKNIAFTVGGVLIIAGFLVGRITNRQEDKALKEINSEEK